jgi:hypothetical protein
MLANVATLYNAAGLKSPAPLSKEDRRSVVEKEANSPVDGDGDVGDDGGAGYGVQLISALYGTCPGPPLSGPDRRPSRNRRGTRGQSSPGDKR